MLIIRTFIALLLASPVWAVQYKESLERDGTVSVRTIIRVDDGAAIPIDAQNRDYQSFLKWQKDGNAITPTAPVVRVDPKAGDKAVLKDSKSTTDEKINALIKVLDLDK